jgi:hypothetical protein
MRIFLPISFLMVAALAYAQYDGAMLKIEAAQ